VGRISNAGASIVVASDGRLVRPFCMARRKPGVAVPCQENSVMKMNVLLSKQNFAKINATLLVG
jgi:hypothetical protein